MGHLIVMESGSRFPKVMGGPDLPYAQEADGLVLTEMIVGR